MRILLSLILALSPCAAWADVSVVTQIHPSYVGSTITAVATRDGVDLATAECTTATNTSGFAKATASLDLSGAGAGYVQVAFLDEFGDPVSTGTEFEIDGSGDPVDRLAFIDAATSSRLAPTESGRTLDVTANGNAGIDWGNIDNPTTSINFSSTTVGTATNVGGASLRSGLGMAAADMDTQLTALESLLEGNAASIGDQGGILANIVAKTDYLPSATAGQNGGLPTVDANNRIAGIQGTITTLDGLDTAQDSQHTATQNALATVDSNVDSILEDTGTTLPGTLSTIGGNVTSILEDTGTTIPGTLSGLATQTSVNTIDGIVDNIYTAFELDGSVYRLTTNALEQGGAVSLDPEDIDNIADATALAVGEGLGEAVWTYDGDRLLTAGTNIVLAKGTGITGFTDLDAAGMRSALGMSAADLDTQLGGIPTTAEFEARTIAAADYVTDSDITGLGTAITQIDAIATNGVTIAEDGLTAESIADGVTIGGGVTLEELQQELANIDIDLGPVSEQLDDIESAIGAISADITPPLQLDIDKDFTFDMPNRTSGVVSALNDIYLSSDSETPHFAFDTSKIDRNKPATITSVEVLDTEGAATTDLVVADEDDTTNCGVKDYLVISKVTNCVESGTYKVKVTYQVAGGRTYVVTGNIIVP